jgi:tetratricopeptide (TPR) repeat protein
VDSRKPNAMVYRGIVLGKMKRHEEALNCFQNVCKKYPNNQDAFFQKGVQLAELGKHEKALDVFDEILKKYKDNVNVIYAKSRSKAGLKNYPEALDLLKQAISRNPKIIRKWAKEEPIFTVLHNNDKFRALVKL